MKLSTAPVVLVRNLGRALLLLLALVQVQAAPPEAMTYQGLLVDANGNPLSSGTPANYPVIFRIFTASTGGTRMWSEQQIVTVDKGNFSVLLGEGTPVAGEVRPALSTVFAGANNADRYMSLSVTIGATTSEMLPRLRLLPAPYAFAASSAAFIAQPNGTPVVSYANNRVEITGPFFAGGGIAGNAAGLTGLTPAQIPPLNASIINGGTFPDSLLSPNVALRAGGNSFTGNQTISGNLGLGTASVTFPLTIGANTLGDKISLWGQSGSSFGFGIQGSLLQIHTDTGGSDIAFGSGSSAAMTETVRFKGNGNVGIGTAAPSGKLTVNGGVRARGGAPGGGGLNDNGYAFTGAGGDNDSGMFSSADGQLEFYSNSNEQMRIAAGGNVGIGTTTPTAKLEVNGAIKATSIQVTAGFTAATLNGEKPPVVYQVPPGNIGTWRDVLVDATTLLGDVDGGRFKVILRNWNSKEVRTVSYQFFAENDADNFGGATRYGWSISSYGEERGFILGTGNNNNRSDIASNWGWFWLRNYRSGSVAGSDSVAFGAGERYKFWFMCPPSISATIILYDR